MPELAPGSVVAGCRIERVVGRGGMGIVYAATQLALERSVALKVIAPELAMDPDFIARFKRESRLAASIEHPHVIPVHEAGEGDGLLYLLMRYIEGTDLRELIVDEGPLAPARATKLVAQTASALAAAHRRGLVHRDVKPANVLVAREGDEEHCYLTDFGIARDVSANTALTVTGSVVGTLDYLAPERIEGAHGEPPADIYALGCVLFQTLTGEVPYKRDTEPAKMFAHMSAEVPSARELAPDTPEELDAIAARAMAKAPGDRFESAEEMAKSLLRATAGHAPPPAAGPSPPPAPPVPAPPPVEQPQAKPTRPAAGPTRPAPAPPPSSPRGGGRRTGLILGGLAVVAAVLVALVVVGGGGDGGGEPSGSSASDQDAGSLGELSPRALEPLKVGSSPDGVAVGEGSVWVADKKNNVVVQVDPSPVKILRKIEVGREPDSIAVGEGGVWVTNTSDDTVSRIDPSTGAVADTIDVGDEPEGIAVGGGAVWVANGAGGSVTRIDPEAGTTSTADVGTEPVQIAVRPEAVWVTVSGEGKAVSLDPSTGRPEDKPVPIGGSPRGIAFAGGSLWISVSDNDAIAVMDPSAREVLAEIPVKSNPREVREGEGAIWVTAADTSTVVAIDISSRKVTADVSVKGEPFGMAVGEGRVWAASLDRGLLTPIDPRGGSQ